MKYWNFEFHSWLPNKKNGDPKFWAISVLPEIQIQYFSKDGVDFHIGWLFWTFSIEYNRF